MAKRKFELKRYDYIGENKYCNAFKAIMNKNHDWWDASEYTWDVHTWTPRTITATNVPTITTTTTAGEESTRYYYNWTALSNAMNNITYTDFITTTLTDGWRML